MTMLRLLIDKRERDTHASVAVARPFGAVSLPSMEESRAASAEDPGESPAHVPRHENVSNVNQKGGRKKKRGRSICGWIVSSFQYSDSLSVCVCVLNWIRPDSLSLQAQWMGAIDGIVFFFRTDSSFYQFISRHVLRKGTHQKQ